jgi:hypothetical protein
MGDLHYWGARGVVRDHARALRYFDQVGCRNYTHSRYTVHTTWRHHMSMLHRTESLASCVQPIVHCSESHSRALLNRRKLVVHMHRQLLSQ